MTAANRLNGGRPPKPMLTDQELELVLNQTSLDAAAEAVSLARGASDPRISNREARTRRVTSFWIRTQLARREKTWVARKHNQPAEVLLRKPTQENTESCAIQDPECHKVGEQPSNNGHTFVNRSPTEDAKPSTVEVESEQSGGTA